MQTWRKEKLPLNPAQKMFSYILPKQKQAQIIQTYFSRKMNTFVAVVIFFLRFLY